MPTQGGDCGIDRGIDQGSSLRIDHGHRAGSQALTQGDHVVEWHPPLPIARGEVVGQGAKGLGICCCDGGRQAVRQRRRVGQKLAQGKIRVSGSEGRVGCHGAFERPGGETSGRAANRRRVGRIAGGEVSVWKAEGWVAHDQEV